MITAISLLCLIATAGAFYRLGMAKGVEKGREAVINQVADMFPYRTEVMDRNTGKRLMHMFHSNPITAMPEADFCALVAELALMRQEPANVVKRAFPNLKVCEGKK